jgi:hypothetical protein
MRTTKTAEVELLGVVGDRALVRVDRWLELWVRLEVLAGSGVEYLPQG